MICSTYHLHHFDAFYYSFDTFYHWAILFHSDAFCISTNGCSQAVLQILPVLTFLGGGDTWEPPFYHSSYHFTSTIHSTILIPLEVIHSDTFIHFSLEYSIKTVFQIPTHFWDTTILFWDGLGVLPFHFISPDTTSGSAIFCPFNWRSLILRFTGGLDTCRLPLSDPGCFLPPCRLGCDTTVQVIPGCLPAVPAIGLPLGGSCSLTVTCLGASCLQVPLGLLEWNGVGVQILNYCLPACLLRWVPGCLGPGTVLGAAGLGGCLPCLTSPPCCRRGRRPALPRRLPAGCPWVPACGCHLPVPPPASAPAPAMPATLPGGLLPSDACNTSFPGKATYHGRRVFNGRSHRSTTYLPPLFMHLFTAIPPGFLHCILLPPDATSGRWVPPTTCCDSGHWVPGSATTQYHFYHVFILLHSGVPATTTTRSLTRYLHSWVFPLGVEVPFCSPGGRCLECHFYLHSGMPIPFRRPFYRAFYHSIPFSIPFYLPFLPF